VRKSACALRLGAKSPVPLQQGSPSKIVFFTTHLYTFAIMISKYRLKI